MRFGSSSGSFNRRKSVKGDNLEGHELLQNSVLEKQGLSNGRLSTPASKGNPVIALPADVHSEVSKKQLELGTQDMDAMKNIETNSQILKYVGVDADIVDKKPLDMVKKQDL